MARAVSVTELLTKKRKVMQFDDAWQESLGSPELTGSWIIWGNSGNGKTSFALQLCKYLCRFGKVAYNSLEEGDGESMRRAFMAAEMEQVKGRVILLDAEPMADLSERLRKHKSPAIIIIDSLQYTGMNYAEYKALKREFKNKLFVFVSHAKGKDPDGHTATKIRYDAGIKIWVEGYVAYATGRYGGGKPYIIWPERVAELQ